jgi:hypothetical protein
MLAVESIQCTGITCHIMLALENSVLALHIVHASSAERSVISLFVGESANLYNASRNVVSNNYGP